jgi:large conductance mechanosensitive channel
MSFFHDFKTFAMRGNVMDMAVGVIIGASFGKIVSSFVNDVLMPPIGLLLGKVDFSNLFVNLGRTDVATLAEAQAKGVPVLSYGVFINTVIDFLIQALVIFAVVRWMNRLMPAPEPAPAPQTKECPYCFTAIDPRAAKCPNCTADLK